MKSLRDRIFDKDHVHHRRRIDEIAQGYHDLQLSDKERVVRRFEMMCKEETPVILEGQQIVLMRTIENLPDCFTKEEWDTIRQNHYIHETGYVSNLLPDYETLIKEGLMPLYESSDEYVRRELNALFDLCQRYKEEAQRIGRDDVVGMLSHIPMQGARTLKEAFQFFRILHFGPIMSIIQRM